MSHDTHEGKLEFLVKRETFICIPWGVVELYMAKREPNFTNLHLVRKQVVSKQRNYKAKTTTSHTKPG